MMNNISNNPVLTGVGSFFKKQVSTKDVAPRSCDEKVIATTFRLPIGLKKYYELMACHSLLSLQGAIIQTLNGVMVEHIHNRAMRDQNGKADRLFNILVSHSVNLSESQDLLKGFGIQVGDLSSEKKATNLLSGELVDFLTTSFNLNEQWILTGEGVSHSEFCLQREFQDLLNLIKNSNKKVTAKIFFDNGALRNPKIYSGAFHPIKENVKCLVVFQESINGINYNKTYNFKPLDFKLLATKDQLQRLVKEVLHSQSNGLNTVEKYAGNIDETKDDHFVLNMLSNFKTSQTSFMGGGDWDAINSVINFK